MRRTPPFQVVTAAVAALVLTLSACGGTTGEEKTSGSNEDAPLIYGAFATPLEEPWDGAIHAALESAAEDGEITYKHIDNLSTSDKMERALRDIAENEKPAAIVGDAFAAEDAVRKVAAGSPTSPSPSAPGRSRSSRHECVRQLAAGPGLPRRDARRRADEVEHHRRGRRDADPQVNRIVNAFVSGVKETNPQATVKVSFINSFFDPATAKQAAEAQIDAGADVMFAERAGVIEAAKEADLPVIGMMVDQQSEAPKNVVTSLIWHMRPTIDEVIAQANGEPAAEDMGKFSFMKVGGSELAPINTDINGGVPEDLVAKVEEKMAAIKDGSFETPVDENAPKGSIDVS